MARDERGVRVLSGSRPSRHAAPQEWFVRISPRSWQNSHARRMLGPSSGIGGNLGFQWPIRLVAEGRHGGIGGNLGLQRPMGLVAEGRHGGNHAGCAWWAPNAPDLEAGMRQEAASRAALWSSGRLGRSGAPRPLGAPLCGPSERPSGRSARPSRDPAARPRALCCRQFSPRGSRSTTGGASRPRSPARRSRAPSPPAPPRYLTGSPQPKATPGRGPRRRPRRPHRSPTPSPRSVRRRRRSGVC